jgi:prepilin-type N-terminal cleavage/methylation domain-containing protein
MSDRPELFSIVSSRSGVRRRCRRGFTLVEIMIVMAIISVLFTIAIPNWLNARTTSQAKACARTLRTIAIAKEQYGMTRRLPVTATPTFNDLVTDGYLRAVPLCPEGYNYTMGSLATEPTCNSGLTGHSLTP